MTSTKRGETRASKSRLVLVLLLIGWENGARFLSQSQSEAIKNQSNCEITFDTQMKTALKKSSKKSTMVNREVIVIWIYPVRWNVLERRVVRREGRTLAPLKFRLFVETFSTWRMWVALVFAIIFSYKEERIVRATRTNQRIAVFWNFCLSVQFVSLKSVGRTCLCQVRHLNKLKNCPKSGP